MMKCLGVMYWVWEKGKEKIAHPHTKESRIRIHKNLASAYEKISARLGTLVLSFFLRGRLR